MNAVSLPSLIIFLMTVSASLTNNVYSPTVLTFNNSSSETCYIFNKLMQIKAVAPSSPMNKSDGTLKLHCKTEDSKDVIVSVPNNIGVKIVPSGVFLDFSITDPITEKCR